MSTTKPSESDEEETFRERYRNARDEADLRVAMGEYREAEDALLAALSAVRKAKATGGEH